ncbi:uncharacterized protein ARB_04570 [Trichophyton benhamiae CBS 112371]|uniref:Uncharacterized protein n=1 Tax=Arthroderma benhamiae (strain ATCC MYA-4681 / CBS 112371) TaxID=663331 RepID=D4AJX0_ARTBC|nr:uncharacterized protein ARB_04570 [Trichophyton benhamiae CBS 112371]EFE37043.1 hypothetical protein ARB_04570 [Trichophyton benhamiae CBS 112371]
MVIYQKKAFSEPEDEKLRKKQYQGRLLHSLHRALQFCKKAASPKSQLAKKKDGRPRTRRQAEPHSSTARKKQRQGAQKPKAKIKKKKKKEGKKAQGQTTAELKGTSCFNFRFRDGTNGRRGSWKRLAGQQGGGKKKSRRTHYQGRRRI